MTDTKQQPLPLTDEQAASLISRLLSFDGQPWETTACYNNLRREAAEAFDAERAARLAAEAERDRLREAVKRWLSWCDDWHPGKPHPYDDLEFARAALAGQEGGNG